MKKISNIELQEVIDSAEDKSKLFTESSEETDKIWRNLLPYFRNMFDDKSRENQYRIVNIFILNGILNR